MLFSNKFISYVASYVDPIQTGFLVARERQHHGEWFSGWLMRWLTIQLYYSYTHKATATEDR